MVGYRCFFLDAAGRIAAREEFEAPTDAAAQALAELLCSERGTRWGFELWQEKRFVMKRD